MLSHDGKMRGSDAYCSCYISKKSAAPAVLAVAMEPMELKKNELCNCTVTLGEKLRTLLLLKCSKNISSSFYSFMLQQKEVYNLQSRT
jgi:hypothetical protein